MWQQPSRPDRRGSVPDLFVKNFDSGQGRLRSNESSGDMVHPARLSECNARTKLFGVKQSLYMAFNRTTMLAIFNYSNEAMSLTIIFNLTTGYVRFQTSSEVLCSCRNWAPAPSAAVQGPYFIWQIPCCHLPQLFRRACAGSGEWATLIPQESRREPTHEICYIKRWPKITMPLLFSQLYSHIRNIKMSINLNFK